MLNQSGKVIKDLSSKINYQLMGGQVLGIKIDDIQCLYLSPYTSTNNITIRGGIPVIFPQFSKLGGLKKHGLARDIIWNTVSNKSSLKLSHKNILNLNVHIENNPEWPHSAELTLQISAKKNLFTIIFSVKNTGKSSFFWTGGLHPYWFTKDILESELHGLSNVTLKDRFNPYRTIETSKFLIFSNEEYECLYDSRRPLLLKTPTHSLKLSMTGFEQWMVWNPGNSGAVKINDLPNSDWRHFICIEPVLVDRPNQLHPNEIFEGALSLELI